MGNFAENKSDPLSLSKFAHMTERVGLAIAGASGGLLVAAGLNHASVELLQSVGFVFTAIIVGAIAFYLGIDVPPATTPTIDRELSSINTTSTIDPVEILVATGTFLASSAAIVSVGLVVFDADLKTSWASIIGFSWLFGSVMQILAGAVARYRGFIHCNDRFGEFSKNDQLRSAGLGCIES